MVYIKDLKVHVSDPKLILKDPKNADEVGKSLNSALIKAVSDLNWKTLWPKRIENKIQSVYIKDLKIHASDPKLIIKDPKKCRWNWKSSKFCSHNGNFRSELSKIITQKDWKQYPIGMYQGSKIYMFQTHNWSWKIQKNADEVEKSLNSALIMAVSHLNWAKKWPKRIENIIQMVYIKDLKVHVSDPKLIMKGQKNPDEVGKSLNSALIMAVSDLNWAKQWPKRIENNIHLVYIMNLKIHVSDPKLIMKDPKNGDEVGKSINSALTMAVSDLNWTA